MKADRFEEGMAVKHCALSLVGEPIMYPEINRFLKLLHHREISSFLVTNAQFPEEIRYLDILLLDLPDDCLLCNKGYRVFILPKLLPGLFLE